MRILPGHPKEFANETPTSKHLMQYAISNPEILPQVATLFQNDHTAFSSLLANRGLTSGNLYNDMNPRSKAYKVVGNRKIMWHVKGITCRIGRMTADAVCEAYTTEPGKYQSLIKIYSDTNWFSPYDVIELKDNRTLVTIVDDILPEEITIGTWLYYARINTSVKEAYVNPELLKEGCEFGFAYTNFYEQSETAYEKYTFNEMATCYLTIQRMKWSISGTAAQMKSSPIWIEHNGRTAWMDYQDKQMLERWAKAREYQLLFGRGTVTENDEVLLKDMKGREILAGDGLINQGDGALKFQYNKLSKGVIHNIMDNMALMSNNDGVIEVGVIAGRKFITDFHDIFIAELKANPIYSVENAKEGVHVKQNILSYEYARVRFTPVWYKWFDSPERPQHINTDGTRNESHRAIFTSLGNVDTGESNLELLALGDRQFKRGTVNGINKGGDMANSVDGSHTHILSETGIAVKDINGVMELYRPFRA